jgi:hypothetical protein
MGMPAFRLKQRAESKMAGRPAQQDPLHLHMEEFALAAFLMVIARCSFPLQDYS